MIMIKSNKGRVELEGTPIALVGELGTTIQAVYQALLNAGIDKTFAEKNIRKQKITSGVMERCLSGGNMRLIDADKVNFNEVFVGASEFAQDTRYVAQILINRQPIAYDVDKVVEQLEELRKECEDPLQDYDPNYFIDKAIEITKGGGVDGN